MLRYNLVMKKVIFVGQAMPRFKKDLHDWPSLNSWLYSINITHDQIQKYFFYSALVDYFPGAKNASHRVPTPEEIRKERRRLGKTLKDFNPDLVIPIGRLSIASCLNKKVEPLEVNIGKTFVINPYGLLNREVTVIPLPHPSGASTWHHKKENKKLLQISLSLLKRGIKGEL